MRAQARLPLVHPNIYSRNGLSQSVLSLTSKYFKKFFRYGSLHDAVYNGGDPRIRSSKQCFQRQMKAFESELPVFKRLKAISGIQQTQNPTTVARRTRDAWISCALTAPWFVVPCRDGLTAALCHLMAQ